MKRNIFAFCLTLSLLLMGCELVTEDSPFIERPAQSHTKNFHHHAKQPNYHDDSRNYHGREVDIYNEQVPTRHYRSENYNPGIQANQHNRVKVKTGYHQRYYANFQTNLIPVGGSGAQPNYLTNKSGQKGMHRHIKPNSTHHRHATPGKHASETNNNANNKAHLYAQNAYVGKYAHVKNVD